MNEVTKCDLKREDIIRMAIEAGGCTPEWDDFWEFHQDALERFAALVAAAEREECVKHFNQEKPYATQAAMVESQTKGRMRVDPVTGDVSIGTIRARGET